MLSSMLLSGPPVRSCSWSRSGPVFLLLALLLASPLPTLAQYPPPPDPRIPKPTKRFVLNLDLPPKDRWTEIYKDPIFKNAAVCQSMRDMVVAHHNFICALHKLQSDLFDLQVCSAGDLQSDIARQSMLSECHASCSTWHGTTTT